MKRSVLAAIVFGVSATAFAADTARAQPRGQPGDPFAAFANSLTAVPPAAALTGKGAFYVPVFSSVRVGAGRTRVDLAVTLSIHNASESEALVLDRIDYFNTFGALVQRYVGQPVALKPFATVEVFIPVEDIRGGTGANFVVGWAATGPIAEPVIEAVMIGNIGTAGFSFAIPGRPIAVVPKAKPQ
jgi:hypothetical protein